MLWFDVETRYKTTMNHDRKIAEELWFDAETRYKTTVPIEKFIIHSCGLM